jgi:hypothetical protein
MTDETKSKSVVASAIKEKVEDVVVEEEEVVEEVEVEEVEVEDVAAVVEEVAKSAAADLTRDVNHVDNNDDGTPSGKRRFFPRVKHLLTPEWEFVSKQTCLTRNE